MVAARHILSMEISLDDRRAQVVFILQDILLLHMQLLEVR